MKLQKSVAPKANKTKKSCHFMNAEDQILGRIAEKVSKILIGKNKVEIAPNALINDSVVVTNIEKIKVTGKKETDKLYLWHTGFPGLQKYIRITLGPAQI